jgi:hypothetical protein
MDLALDEVRAGDYVGQLALLESAAPTRRCRERDRGGGGVRRRPPGLAFVAESPQVIAPDDVAGRRGRLGRDERKPSQLGGSH